MNIQSPFDLDAVKLPVEKARGLPNQHYVDPQTFEREKQALFFTQWAGLGFAKDVPEIGDAKPVNFLGVPLLLLRDKTGTVRVYQNTCRHRGMILVDEPKNISGAIRCPYHSWCYGLDGKLVTTPHVGGPGQNKHEEIKRSELGLFEIRSHTYLGVVFINMDGKAAPFEEAHAHLLERWQEFDKPIFHGGADSSFKLEVNCNWKLAAENYCESYHLPWIHPGLNSYSRLEDHYHIEEASHYSGQGTLVYRPMLDESGKRFPDFAGLGEKWDEAAEYITLYPNVLFGVHRDHAFAILLEPVNFDKTVEHIEIFYASEEVKADHWEPMRQNNSAMWKSVFKEDIFVVEGMQKGRHGVHFDGGKFSPVMDNPTHCFHHWVAERFDQ